MSAMETDAAVGVDALSSAFDDASAMTGDAAIAAFAAILAGHADRDADDTGVRLKEVSSPRLFIFSTKWCAINM